MKTPFQILMDNASTDPRVLAIANRAVKMPVAKVEAPVVLEEAKKKSIFSEEGEGGDGGQSGSSAITTDTLGDYKYAGRGWQRPARDPKKKDQLPEEKNIDSDCKLYKEEDEGNDWVWEREDLAERLADKLADLLTSIEDGDTDDVINAKLDAMEFEDDLFYEPEDGDELDDTPYTMEGAEDAEDDGGIEDEDDDDEDELEESTLEEQNQVVSEIVADCSTFTLTGDQAQDEFAKGLDMALCEVIQEEVADKATLIRKKVEAGKRMKRMASKMRSKRKQKFHKTDSATVAKRVHTSAVKALKDKVAQSKGGKYEDLSLSAKVDVDQQAKKRANLLPTLERKMLTKYKAKIAQRRKAKTSKPVVKK